MDLTNPTAAPVSSGIQVTHLDHVAIVVTDVDRCRVFYTGVLGLLEISRPPSFDFPGAWFQLGPQVLHVLGMPNADPVGQRHFCLWVADVHAAARHVASHGCPVLWGPYKIEGIDRFFTADPDGNRIEIQGNDGRG